MKLVAGALGADGGLGAGPIRLLMVPNNKRPRRTAPPGEEPTGGNLLTLLPYAEWFPDQGSCFKIFFP